MAFEQSLQFHSLRHVIEDRPVIVGDDTHQLQLMNVSEHRDGGLVATIAVEGAAERVHIGLSDELFLNDPIAFRLRVVYFVRRIVSQKPIVTISE